MSEQGRRPRLSDLAPAWWKSILMIPIPAALFVLGFGLPLSGAPRAVGAFAGVMVVLLLLLVPGYLSLAVLAFVRAAAPDAATSIRVRRTVLGLCLAAGLALCWPADGLARELEVRSRQHFLRALPARAAPITSALARYRDDNGRYPPSLQSLVPGYLAAIPAPGAEFAEEFTYRRSDNSNAWRLMTAESNPPYELSVRFGMLDGFRTLRYWPSDSYPERISGHPVLAHVDGWVYVDD